MRETFMLTSDEVTQALGEYLVNTSQLDSDDYDNPLDIKVVFTQYGTMFKVEVNDEE